MTRLRRAAATVLAPAALALGCAPPSAAAVVVGIGDQKPAVFADGRLRALGLREARLIVPWDAASSEPTRVQAWLDATAAAGLRPHVAFEHLRSDHCPDGPCVLPTRAQYRAAVALFHQRFPQVTSFSTWNEANHESQPVAARPEAVAGYWQELTRACPSCTVVAGDVLDSGSYVQWLRRFDAAAGGAPRLWGLHDYGDVTYGRTTGADNVLAAVDGELWLEETGGIVTLRNAAGRVTLSTDEARAADAIDRAFAIARARPRITRMYVYQWQAASLDRFDSGLVRPDGSSRPSLARLQAQLAGAATRATTTAAATAPRWRVRWSTARPGRLLLRVTCRTAGRRCVGRVRVSTRGRALGTRRYATSVAHGTVTLRFAVPATLRRALRRAATRRLALSVAATVPAVARSRVVVTLPRPPGR